MSQSGGVAITGNACFASLRPNTASSRRKAAFVDDGSSSAPARRRAAIDRAVVRPRRDPAVALKKCVGQRSDGFGLGFELRWSAVNAYTAHREWASRPPDERYASVHALYEAARARRIRTEERTIETVAVRTEESDIAACQGGLEVGTRL